MTLATILTLLFRTALIVTVIAVTFLMLRRKIPLKAILLLLASGIVSQQPWRRDGSLHIVASTKSPETPVHIVQLREQFVNGTYLVAKDSDNTWKWFGIGNDELFWYHTRLTTTNGIVRASRYGTEVASYDPADGRVTWYGHKKDWSNQTAEFP